MRVLRPTPQPSTDRHPDPPTPKGWPEAIVPGRADALADRLVVVAAEVDPVVLVAAHARHIERAARKVRHRAPTSMLDVDDLIQEGAAACLSAARRYDPTYGTQFWVWSCRRVYGAMIDAVRRDCDYSRDEIAAGMRGRRAMSLLLPDNRDGKKRLAHDPVDYRREPMSRFALDDLIRTVFPPNLKPRHAALVRLLYLDGLTMELAGRELGMSKSRVSQIVTGLIAGARQHCKRIGIHADNAID